MVERGYYRIETSYEALAGYMPKFCAKGHVVIRSNMAFHRNHIAIDTDLGAANGSLIRRVLLGTRVHCYDVV
jgi:hypothetical protein